MLTPGPDHPITVQPAATRWRAFFNNHVIADSANALVLQESSMAPVVYFPMEDVGMEYMARTDRSTTCAYKGDASYFTLRIGGEIAENVAWTYENAHNAVRDISGYVAFYGDRVEVYPVDEERVNPHHHRDASAARHEHERERRFADPNGRDPNQADLDVADVVQHTDSGAGASQREHWDTNLENPDRPDGGVR